MTTAKADIPNEAKEPLVQEVNLSKFPVLTIVLSGEIPERSLVQTAHDLKDEIETIPEILSVSIGGDLKDTIDVIIDPLKIETYNIANDVIQFVSANNKLISSR